MEPPAVKPVEMGELQVCPPSVVRITYPLIPCTIPADSFANAIDESSLPSEVEETAELICHDLPRFVDRKTRGLPPGRLLVVENQALEPAMARLLVSPYSLEDGAGILVEEIRVQLLPPFVVVKTTKYPASGSPISIPLFVS
jgi:hypothetical protein